MLLNRLWLLSLLFTPLLAQNTLFKQPCVEFKGDEYALLRTLSSSQKLLLVNTRSLTTSIYPVKEMPAFSQCKQDSTYQNLKRTVLSGANSTINRGLVKGLKDAYVLSVDMCPSRKEGFELDLFTALIKAKKAFPVTISMTKKWAMHHRSEFEQLKAWDDQKELNITWMNHGAFHPYKRDVPIEDNFINLDDVDFTKEVLENEAFLIEEGRVPSVFYRFAGLVSNEKAFKHLVEDLGLIPIGSLAWLAKGEKVRKGSIVLVHGNKNERLGVKLFLKTKQNPPVITLSEMFGRE